MSRYFDWPSSLKRFLRGDTARAEDVNAALDQLSAGLDTLDQDVDRAIKAPPGESLDLNIPAAQRAGKVLAFDANGAPIVMTGGWRWRGDWLTATQYDPTEMFRDPISKNIYATVVGHVSSSVATDALAGKITLAVNLVDVETAKNTAAGSANAASISAGNAAGSESAAQGYANAASGHATSAGTSAGNASADAGLAATARGQAQSAAALAQDWASKTGATVDGSNYSAKKHALDAAQSAQDAAGFVVGPIANAIHTATSKATPADADELPIADSADSWSLKKLTLANLLAWVKSKPLTGLSLADTSAVTATDTVLQAVGKLQAGKAPVSALDALLDVPTSTVTSAAYILQLADRGKCVDVGHAITVPTLATVAFTKGSVINLQNNSATSRTITAESGATVYLAGDSTKTGPFTLKGYGWAVLRKIDTASTWVISGAGI